MATKLRRRPQFNLASSGTQSDGSSGGAFGTRAQWIALVTLCTVLFLTFLDNTIVSVALADVQSRLHAGVTSLQWVVNGYAVMFAGFMLAGGTLGDLFGRKEVMLGGVAVFCAGSIVAATAPGVNQLIAGRVIMGIGAAASEPGTLSVIRHLYPERRKRAHALGVWAAVSGLALALGPVIGGALVGAESWRSIFWFNLFFGAVALAMAAVFVPESSDRQGRRLDIPGIVLGVGALSTLSIAVIQGEDFGYSSTSIVALFVVALASALAFIIVECRRSSPLLELRFFRRLPFLGSNFVAFSLYFGTFAIFFFTALYLEEVTNRSAFQVAVDFIPMAVGMILTSVLTGSVVARIGPRFPMAVGCLLAAAGLLLTSSILGPSISSGSLDWVLALAGVGFGMALVPVTSAALGVVPSERSGMAASVTNTSRELGAVFGVAVLGALVNSKLTGQLAHRLKAIGIPPHFQNVVITAITTGNVPASSSSVRHSSNPAIQKIINEVISAAFGAFGSGLHLALEVSGALVLLGAAVALVTMPRKAEIVER